MQLINTIEINPYDYSKQEYSYPDATSAAEPFTWNEYWLQCISDGGLGNLKSIKNGSYLVDINNINNEELFLIIKKELSKVDLDEFEEQVEHLVGGVVIEVENKIIIEPSCCGDLENLSGWENIFHSEPGAWQNLWIGHPWIFYKRANGMVEISDYTDLNLEDFKDIKAVYTLPEKELAQEIQRIRRAQDDFIDKIRSMLTEMKVADATGISKPMTSDD